MRPSSGGMTLGPRPSWQHRSMRSCGGAPPSSRETSTTPSFTVRARHSSTSPRDFARPTRGPWTTRFSGQCSPSRCTSSRCAPGQSPKPPRFAAKPDASSRRSSSGRSRGQPSPRWMRRSPSQPSGRCPRACRASAPSGMKSPSNRVLPTPAHSSSGRPARTAGCAPSSSTCCNRRPVGSTRRSARARPFDSI